MVSRVNRVLLASFGLVLLSFAVAAAIGSGRWSGLVTFLVLGGIGFLAPQLYLARTDDTVSPRSRVRFGVVMTALTAFFSAGSAAGSERYVVGTLGLGLLVGLAVYEFVDGYRDATAE